MVKQDPLLCAHAQKQHFSVWLAVNPKQQKGLKPETNELFLKTIENCVSFFGQSFFKVCIANVVSDCIVLSASSTHAMQVHSRLNPVP